MKKNTREHSRSDEFAKIASRDIFGNKQDLIEPRPIERTERYLPSETLDEAAVFAPLARMNTPEQLQQELEVQRQHYEGFMQDVAPPLPSSRKKIELQQFDWRLETNSDRQDFNQVLSGKGAWENVHIPHYGGPPGKAAAYYRTIVTLTIEQIDMGAIFICFKGVDYKAHVFINGSYLGSHEGFFAPFEFDITSYVRTGENILVVKVENDFVCKGNSRGYDGEMFEGDKLYAATGLGYDDPDVGWHHCPPGMGIYQDVYVEARSPVHVHDVFVRPVPDERRAEAWIEVYNCEYEPRAITLELAVYGQNFEQEVLKDFIYHPVSGREIGLGDSYTEAMVHSTGKFSKPVALSMSKGPNVLKIPFEIPGMRLWDVHEPWLYQIQVKAIDSEGNVLDTFHQQFGMRSFRMDTESDPKGMFSLNDKPVRLRGANTMGHEQQCVAKKDWDQLRDDILLAKICHMNFLRITQRPVQPEVYEFCDKLGLMTQTDLPLFGVLRRTQFCEAVRQAEEMERLVRSHPCNILVSYINEPFPNANNAPHRHLTRDELLEFFNAADIAIHLQNPDRVIKPVDGDYDPPAPGLPDNHCYTAWYNGHGLDVGKLHKGYWQPVKPGWMYGCGEFGAEGLDPVGVMRRYYPEEWLPHTAEEEKTWSPNRIVGAQTGKFHYLFFETSNSLENWVQASQAHQAWAVRFMTEAFRRDSRMVSFAVHLFIDAFPSGWMKTIMDVDRQPKPAYFAYRDALMPLLASLRTDRLTYFAGDEIPVEAWICHDLHDIPEGVSLHYQVEMGDQVIASGKTPADIPSCSSQFQGFIKLKAPEIQARTVLKIRLGLLDNKSNVLCDTDLDVEVFPQIELQGSKFAYVVGAVDGKAAQLAEEMGMALHDAAQVSAATIFLIDDYQAFLKQQDWIIERVKQGARAVFLELSPEGTYDIAGSSIDVKRSSMSPLHFVSRDTGHEVVKGFRPEDFRLWYDPAADSITPLLFNTFTAEDFTAVLTSGNTNSQGEWGPALAVGERKCGRGSIFVCQINLTGRTSTNPVAKMFACRLLRI